MVKFVTCCCYLRLGVSVAHWRLQFNRIMSVPLVSAFPAPIFRTNITETITCSELLCLNYVLARVLPALIANILFPFVFNCESFSSFSFLIKDGRPRWEGPCPFRGFEKAKRRTTRWCCSRRATQCVHLSYTRGCCKCNLAIISSFNKNNDSLNVLE